VKYRFLSILRCSACQGELKLDVVDEISVSWRKSAPTLTFRATHCAHQDRGDCAACETKEIREGLLTCKACQAQYPIVHSVPRMLPKAHSTQKEYHQVSRHFQAQWKYWGKHARSFGKDVRGCMEYLHWTLSPQPQNSDFFNHKLILDAGCGHGKYVAALSAQSSEVVGMDITRAIDLCQEMNGNADNVHLVQADVIHPPFALDSFDYVFSCGVIHHTPDTRRAFAALSRLPKKGGGFGVWVYPFRAPWWEIVQGALRSLTTRLPPTLLRALCYIPVPLLSIPKFKAYSGTSLKNSSWSECAQVIFDFYGPKYQTHHTEKEIMKWFEQEHYEQLETGPDPTSVMGVRQ